MSKIIPMSAKDLTPAILDAIFYGYGKWRMLSEGAADTRMLTGTVLGPHAKAWLAENSAHPKLAERFCNIYIEHLQPLRPEDSGPSAMFFIDEYCTWAVRSIADYDARWLSLVFGLATLHRAFVASYKMAGQYEQFANQPGGEALRQGAIWLAQKAAEIEEYNSEH